MVLVGVVFVQSVIWVGFFYLQDRVEPEPTGHVLVAFAAGMAAASLVALPIEQTFFHISDWMYRSETDLVLAATCVHGALVSLLVYAIVRYGFMPDAEFDEPADGMAYGAFIGCGFAAVSSLTYLALHPTFTLFAIADSAAMNVLVYASVGALVGYLVGRTKFRPRGAAGSYALAVFAGALLVGAYQMFVDYAFVAGARYALWAGTLAAVVFALLVLGAATALMFRITGEPAAHPGRAERRLDPLALGAGVVLLAAGAVAAHAATRAVLFQDARHAIAFAYDPAAAHVAGPGLDEGRVTQAAFTTHGSAGLPLIFTARTPAGSTVAVQARPGTVALDRLDPLVFLTTPDPIGLTLTDVTVGGRRGVRLRYAYQIDPPARSRELPRMRWAYTDVVPSDAETFALSFDADPGSFDRDARFYEDLLSTVTWPHH